MPSESEWIDGLIREVDQAFSQRSEHDPKWQDIADVMAPQFADFTTQRTPGQRRDFKIIDAHGIEAGGRFARSLSGLLTPEGYRWLGLRVADPKIGEIGSVKSYLEMTERTLLDCFHSPSSAFYQMSEEFYLQIGYFGNSPVFIGEHEGKPYFQSVFLGECAMDTDERGQSIADYRRWKPTAWQLFSMFGTERLPKEVLDALKNKPGQQFPCCHIVRRRKKTDPPSLAGHPIISIYLIEKPRMLLRKPGGFFEDPMLFPRWRRAQNSQYGYGCGENALGDVKMLQKVARDTARGIHKSVDPNVIVAGDGTVQPRVNMNPGGFWYADWPMQGGPRIQQVPFSGNVSHGVAYEEKLYSKIDKHFHLDAFELPPIVTPDGAKNHMSATEFAGRQRQQLQFAGPMLARLRAEFLFPLVRRSYMILLRSKILPPPPPELQRTRVIPEYISPLAIALGSHDADTIMNFYASLGLISQFDPRVVAKVNPARTVDALADAHHVPRSILNTQDEYDALVAGEAAQQQAAMEAEQLQVQSDANEKNARALSLARSA